MVAFLTDHAEEHFPLFLTSICGRRYITVVVETMECTP
jgi:hypothetical protein